MKTTKFLIIAIFIALVLTGCRKKKDEDTFIFPLASSEWKTATVETIKWREDVGEIDDADKVSILLYKQGKTGEDYLEIIASNTPNDGDFEWFIDPIIAEGGTFFLAICPSPESSGDSIFDFEYMNESEAFSIILTDLGFSFTYPKQNSVLERGNLEKLTWTSTNELANEQVKVDLYEINGDKNIFVNTIINIADNSGTAQWLVPSDLPDKDYILKIYDLSKKSFGISPVFNVVEKGGKVLFPTTGDTLNAYFTYNSENYLVEWKSQGWGTVDVELWWADDDGKWSVISTNEPDDGEMNWHVDQEEILYALPLYWWGDGYLKVINHNNTSEFFTSNVFTILGAVTYMIAPNNNSIWEVGETYTIEWESQDWGNIDIFFEIYGNQTKIFQNISDNGSQEWTVPEISELPPNTEKGAGILIKKSDNPDFFIINSEDFFVIKRTEAETIEITSPTGNTTWEAGNNYNITWNGSGNGSVKVQLYQNSSLIETISNSTSNDGQLQYSVPSSLSSGTNYKVKISKTDNSSISDESNNFTINNNSSEELEITSPSGNTTWETGNSYDIIWNGSGNGSVKVQLYQNSSLIETISNSTSNDGQLQYSVPSSLSSGTNYKVKISKTDNSSIYDESSYFTINNNSSTIYIEDFEGDQFIFQFYYSDGCESWIFYESDVYEGSWSFTSGVIEDEGCSNAFVEEYFEAGTISFYSKVSSEEGYDKLEFYIDGDLQEEWSGEIDWAEHSYSVGAGLHKFEWIYTKDESNESGIDAGLVDYITFPPVTDKKNINRTGTRISLERAKKRHVKPTINNGVKKKK